MMKFSPGSIVIFSNFSCQEVPSITPKFLRRQLQPALQQPFSWDISAALVWRYCYLASVRGDSKNHKQSRLELLTFGAKDRIYLQVWFGLQIPGCHSNPKSKGGLFSVLLTAAWAGNVLRLA